VKAGIITEPLLGINGEEFVTGEGRRVICLVGTERLNVPDFTERWVFADNWTYTADVTPFTSGLTNSAQSALLVFYGLDTIANIVSVIL
jgi:hypothetical protein